MRKKSTNLPWMNKRTRKLIEGRKRLYVAEGGERTEVWKEEKRRIDKLIVERKRGYMDTQRAHILQDDASRNFFKHAKNFSRFEKPKEFDVRSLLPDKSDAEVADVLADFFNKVSREFEALEPHQIPITKDRKLPVLNVSENPNQWYLEMCSPSSSRTTPTSLLSL